MATMKVQKDLKNIAKGFYAWRRCENWFADLKYNAKKRAMEKWIIHDICKPQDLK